MSEANKPVVLAAGPDTAYYTIRPTATNFMPIRRELPIELQTELEELKRLAQQADEWTPTRWSFHGQTLFMRDKGGSQFKWILENDFVILSVGRGKKTGVIGRVRLNSVYLWGYLGDLGKALSEVHSFLSVFFGPYITLDQSGLDLAADVLFFDETMDAERIKEHFISRAVLDDERPVYLDDGYVDGPSSIHRRWKKIAGLSFGLHTSATSAVIYNKTAEIKYHSPEKVWFVDLWRHRAAVLGIEYHEQMTVWRIEIRFQRTAFREFPNVSGAYDVLEHIRDLWAYGVGHPGGGADGLPDGWLRCVIPSQDSNRARWPVTSAWEVVQHAFDPEPLPLSAYEQQEQEKEALLQEVDAYLEAHPMAPRETVLVRRAHQNKSTTSSSAPAAAPVEPADAPLFDPRPFIRQRKGEVNMRRAVEQIAGWLSTIEAWRGGYAVDQTEEDRVERDYSETLHFVARLIDAYFEEKAVDFSKLVRRKRVLFRLQEAFA